jgi:predicted small lipoprotein YifL
MARRLLPILTLLLPLLLVDTGCGKKGPPIPPERAQVLSGDSR